MRSFSFSSPLVFSFKKHIFKKSCALFLFLTLFIYQLPLTVYAGELITSLPQSESLNLKNDLSVIGLGDFQKTNNNFSKLQDAYRYVLENTYKNKSKLLVYPEKFTYKDEEEEIVFNRGAIFNIDEDEVIGDDRNNKFNYLLSSGEVDLGRAKALYDGNIAILDVSKNINGEERHLTFESGAYCNVLHTYVAKHEQCFSGMSDYEQYLNDDKYPKKEETSIVYIYPEDIKNGKLLRDGETFFGVLILPDLTFGFEDEVASLLGANGLEAINNYVSKGGTVLSSGKSAVLLEEGGLVAPQTVDDSLIVKQRFNQIALDWQNTNSFAENLFKLGLIQEDGNDLSYFLSSFMLDASFDSDLKELASIGFNDDFIFQDSKTLGIAVSDKVKMTALAYKKYGNGNVVVMNIHPASGSQRYFPFVFNALFLSGAKELIADLNVVQKTNPEFEEDIIPAYEKDVGLLLSYDIKNFYNKDISQVNFEINIAKGFQVADFEGVESCVLEELWDDEEYSEKIICTRSKISAFGVERVEIPIKIVDPYVARGNWNEIHSADGKISYTRENGQNREIENPKVYLRARNGAEIRGEYNPDPSSFYPLRGEGVYIDNVLAAQNKNHTNALEVEHVAVVPLISPIVDNDDQASLTYTLEFDNEYYQAQKTSNAFVFPFKNYGEGNRDYDLLDYAKLKCKDVVLSADWDTPVKTSLMARSELGLSDVSCSGEIEDIRGKDYAFFVNNDDLIAKQSYYKDADNYYEHATQRQLVYLDETKSQGAKKNLIFARNDVYFYDNENYPLPEGVDDSNIFLSIDRFSGQCGDEKGIINQGYFSHEKANGILANEYDNALSCKLDKEKVSVKNIEEASQGKIRLSHYLFPIAERDNIQEVSDLFNFDEQTLEYKDYPEVKFTKAHTVDFTLNQKTTPRGGRFIFSLPEGIAFESNDPVGEALISFSADHIAFREIYYDAETNIIKAEFIRGKMPNERNGKPDILQISFEKLNVDDKIDVSVELESLEYDIGNPDNMEKYIEADFVSSLSFEKKPFLSLPSLILTFRLKRGDDGQESFFNRYENFEPFVRYGVYIQELLKHRTVYGYSENHPVSDPGIVLSSGGFSCFSNIGAASIPFKEYLQTGIRQITPLSYETSRIDYLDVWNRQWSTPIRTVLPDVPPIPPPLRNFMINSTFEIRDKETGERQLEWASDREAELLHKLKVVNNYPKYFECTVCDGNEFLLRASETGMSGEKLYIDPDDSIIYPNPGYGQIPEITEEDLAKEFSSTKSSGLVFEDEEIKEASSTDDVVASSTAVIASSSEEVASSSEEIASSSLEIIKDQEVEDDTASTTETEIVPKSNVSSSSEEVAEEVETKISDDGEDDSEDNSTDSQESSGTSTLLSLKVSDFAGDSSLMEIIESEAISDKLYLRRANSAKYGICYQNAGDMVSGGYLSSSDRAAILNVTLCEDEESCPDMSQIPTISKIPDNESGKWNFSKSVLDYYPDNYISDKMWNLSHYDYSDNAYSKAYPFHMDNLLTNLDNVRQKKIRPHNIVAQPMYKGLGYSIEYDRNYESEFYQVEGKNIIGWQSDNLQNKDDTLLAGQEESYEISVDKFSQISDRMIEITELEDGGEYVAKAMKNLYTCLFNRWRVKVDPESQEIVYTDNVYVNNVVPIIPELSKNDSRLTNYTCDPNEYYTPETIHEIDNIKETYSRDWLYFGIALRGGAKETINIVSELNPLEGVHYEGLAKVNEGARFTYWNPANGPNSFLVVDNDVNVVEAKRSDIVLTKEIIPVEVPTFNAQIYHAISLEDPKEHWRGFSDNTFVKHYGFGDAVTSVNVGVHKKLQANGTYVNPGEETTVKIELFNNTGYDWNLIKNKEGVMPIESNEIGEEAINANDYLFEMKHSIREPVKFNFLEFVIPEEIKDYVEIVPATHNIRVAGILFDFENINVTRLRDSFKGSYYVDLRVLDGFPDELMGKAYEIQVNIKKEFFDKLPGYNDPVDHDYELKVPAIRFGVPYKEGSGLGWREGRVFDVSGHSTDIVLSDELPEGVQIESIKKVALSRLNSLRALASEQELKQEKMLNYYNKSWFGEEVPFKTQVDADGKTKVILDFASAGMEQFPLPLDKYGYADEARMYFVMKSKAEELPFGESIVNENLKVDFKDCNDFEKVSYMSAPLYRKVKASGADLSASYEVEMIGGATGEKLDVQKLFRVGENFARINIKVENKGSQIAYHPKARVYLPDNVEALDDGEVNIIKSSEGDIVEIEIGRDIPPGDISIISLVLKEGESEDEYSLNLFDRFIKKAVASVDQRELVEKIETQFDLTAISGENQVTQTTAESFSVPVTDFYEKNSRLLITSQKTGDNVYDIKLKAQNEQNVFYKLFSRADSSKAFKEVESGYSQSGEYSVVMEVEKTEIFGAMYSLKSVINEYGEEKKQYVKLAESSIFKAPILSFSGSLSSVSTVPPINPMSISITSLLGQDITQTNERDVLLKFEAPLETAKMMISENENFSGAELIPFEKSIKFELSEALGYKTIYVRFYRNDLSVLGVRSDVIGFLQKEDVKIKREDEDEDDCVFGTCETGKYVKATRIYVIQNGILKYIPNLEELRKYAGQVIYDVSQTELNIYDAGDAKEQEKYKNGMLLRGTWLYHLKDGTKEYLGDYSVLSEYSDQEIDNISHQGLRQFSDF